MSMKIWKTKIQQRKVLILFDDMIADMKSNKKLLIGLDQTGSLS